MKKNNHSCLFTWRIPKKSRIQQARKRLRQRRADYWRNKCRLVESNADRFNANPVITDIPVIPPKGSFKNRYWWMGSGTPLVRWIVASFEKIEAFRVWAGGASIFWRGDCLARGNEMYELAQIFEHPKMLQFHEEEARRTIYWDERIRFWGRIQRDVYFPILEEYCNVKLNPDGSGALLDGFQHELNWPNLISVGTRDSNINLSCYNAEGERHRCRLALDAAIENIQDWYFTVKERSDIFKTTAPTKRIYFYDGTRRFFQSKAQVEIGSDEYNRLLDRMVEIARTCSDPDPGMVSPAITSDDDDDICSPLLPDGFDCIEDIMNDINKEKYNEQRKTDQRNLLASSVAVG